MGEPRRIQLSRQAGWRKPDNAVVVSRPSKWGNPFRIGQRDPRPGREGERLDQAGTVALHRERARADLVLRQLVREELVGRDVACWCSLDGPCHGDTLLEMAREEAARGI